jgi:hypothetical protein
LNPSHLANHIHWREEKTELECTSILLDERIVKMSQEIDLREDSDDNGEWPNNAMGCLHFHFPEKKGQHEDVGSGDAKVYHRESHEGISWIAAILSDSERQVRRWVCK